MLNHTALSQGWRFYLFTSAVRGAVRGQIKKPAWEDPG